MFLITKILLPYFTVDSMAAWLQTCKESYTAFEPVEIKVTECLNRGLLQRLGLAKELPTGAYLGNCWVHVDKRVPDWIRHSGPALVVCLKSQMPIINDLIWKHRQNCRTCFYDLKVNSCSNS